jgi:hypothetical protein
MVRYICMLFDATGTAVRIEPFEAATDRCAADHAIMLQLVTRNATAFEVWHGSSKVASYYGKRRAWSSRPIDTAANSDEAPVGRPERNKRFVAGLSR